ncbi:MAG: glycosyltransferase family 39 protein [Sphingorhabdus sp.]
MSTSLSMAGNISGSLGLERGIAATQSASMRSWLVLAAIAIFTLFVRFPELGNPAPDFDEQLYFLAGDRMWSGDIPFVDIWDRKPVGLFLIYAAIRLLGGDGILQYQLVAALFAIATGWLVYCITLRFASWKGALAAALIYVLYLRALNSNVGQTETFLMLFCVGTMLLAVKSLETDDNGLIKRYAMAAMFIMGLALQVKYTVLPQCVFFGLFFLWRIGTRTSFASALLKNAPAFVALGLLPTLIVAGYYLAIGHFEDFYYANFTSIFDRGKLSGNILKYCIVRSTIMLLPLSILALSAWLERNRQAISITAFAAISIWALACLSGIIMTGSIYIHYCVPLVPALAILTGAFVDKSKLRLIAPMVLAIYVLSLTDYTKSFAKNDRDIASMETMTAAMLPHVQKGCIYIYDGPTMLYTMTGSCLPTKRPYPDHLNNLQEKHSMGLDQAAEVRRVLTTRPVAIVTADRRVVPHLSREPKALVDAALARDYHFVTRQFYDRRFISVYLRNDLLPPARTR